MYDCVVNLGCGNGTTSDEHGIKTNSSSGNSKRKTHCWGFAYEEFFKNPEKRTAVLFVSTVMWVDPFFFYIVEIKDDKKCLVFEKRIAYIACALLTILDFLYVISYRRHLLKLCKNLLRDAEKVCRLLFNVLIILPLPQVMVVSLLLQRKVGWTILIAEFVLILQHVSRFFLLMLKWNTTAAKREAAFFMWTLMFLFLYVAGSHFFAGLWYNGAIYAETECWKEACSRKLSECSIDIFYCGNSANNIKLVDDFCSRNTSTYDFGIYREAHQSGMLLEGTDYYQKLLYFFRWSLQNISSFGQNIQPVTQLGGNMFALFIIYTGVVVFFFLVGKLQSSLQADTEGFGKKQKLQETKQWMPFKKLSEDLQSQVTNYHNQNDVSRETKAINIENIFSGLSENLRRRMNQELCMDLLKKVEEFGRWGEAAMQDLCDCVKPVFYGERTRLIRVGEPIDEMIFVMQGMLWTYTSHGIVPTSSGNDHRNHRNKHLKDGDSCGKELANWVEADAYTFDLPISTKTIQAVTDVEAFALLAYDLQNIFIKHHEAALFIQIYWRFQRDLRFRTNA